MVLYHMSDSIELYIKYVHCVVKLKKSFLSTGSITAITRTGNTNQKNPNHPPPPPQKKQTKKHQQQQKTTKNPQQQQQNKTKQKKQKKNKQPTTTKKT